MIIPNLPLANIIDNLQAAGTNTGWNSGQFFAQCVCITVLFVVLWIFAWKPVRTILEERRKTIEDAMANAERIKKELSDTEASRLSIIHKANEQANLIIAESEKSAAAVTEQRAKEATRQAEDIVKNAHEASVLERNRLMEELKRHVGELVIQTTEKVTGKVLTADDQIRLNAETLRQLGAKHN